MKHYTLILLVLTGAIFTSTPILAQQPGNGASKNAVMGKVIEANTSTPIEFAAVSVLTAADSTLVTGTITNEAGAFMVQTQGPGDFVLKVEFLGYNTFYTPFTLNAEKPNFQAGKIELSVSENILAGVEITAEKSYFQQSIDKKVYNIERDIVASSGTASEALQNIPSVTVDLDGNVSLRGNTNVRIFIDGKPSGLMGSSMVAILEQIPANTIESIEVVTNPSARYEAEGGGGIINIVLKKDKKIGLNGVVSAGVTSFPGYDGTASLNYRDQKWNVNTSFSYNDRETDGWSNVYRKVTYEDSLSFYSSDGVSVSGREGGNIRGGVDYYINESSTIGVSGSYNTNSNFHVDTNNYFFLDNDSLLNNRNIRTGSGSGDEISYNAGLNYRQVFSSPKHLLTADAFYSKGAGDGFTAYEEFSYDPLGLELGFPILQQIYNDDANEDINIQTDYVHPFDNGNQLEGGLKFTREFRDNDVRSESVDEFSGEYENDDSISNRFRFDQQILAAYAIWNSSIGKLGYQLGLRAEQTFLLSELVTTSESFDRDYLGLFPSAHLKYTVQEGIDLSASYSRRINRPRAWFLNPFPEFSDPYTYRQGNPFLLPEYENSFEAGLTRIWEKHTLSSTLFYRTTNGEFSAYTIVDSNGLSRTSFENFENETEYGLELVVRNEFTKFWSATSSLNLNRTIIDASNIEEGLSNALTNYNARVMMFFKLFKQTSLQLTYSYWRPWAMAQGMPQPVTFLDAGIKSDFLNNKLSVNLTFTDIFDTRQFSVTNESFNFYQEFDRKRESRSVGIRLSYKFGQQDYSKKRQGQGNGDYEGGGMEMF
jgi:outer membrane receptor protein involved in Fe transport